MVALLSSPRLLRAASRLSQARQSLQQRRRENRAASASRSGFYVEVWRDAARQLGATVTNLTDEILEIRRGALTTKVWRNRTELDNPVTLAVAGDKPLVYKLLAARGIPTAAYAEFTLEAVAKAVDFLEQRQGACVVKPAGGAGGRGVTTGIRSRRDLVYAAVHAGAHGRRLIIEDQLEGDVYRLLYLNGTLIDAVVRSSPGVVADGRSSVRALVRNLNDGRMAAGSGVSQRLLSIDLDMRRTLAGQGLTLSSTPPAGTRVILKKVINDNAGAENFPASHLLCASIVRDGAAAAASVGARLAGVDVITRDPSRPLLDTGGVILEVNTTPGFYYHYHQAGARVDVARLVLGATLGGAGAATPSHFEPESVRH